jgi:hypothetical protein
MTSLYSKANRGIDTVLFTIEDCQAGTWKNLLEQHGLVFLVMMLRMMLVRQKMVLEPAPMRDTLIASDAHRTESHSRCYRRADLYQRLVSSMPARL